MSKIIRKIYRIPAGWEVEIEIENAYTNGKSRFETRIIPYTTDQTEFLAYLTDDSTPLPPGTVIIAPGETKAALERLLQAPYERWLRWKTTKLEAAARALPAPVINALAAREDAAWGDYLTALNRWRNAP